MYLNMHSQAEICHITHLRPPILHNWEYNNINTLFDKNKSYYDFQLFLVIINFFEAKT